MKVAVEARYPNFCPECGCPIYVEYAGTAVGNIYFHEVKEGCVNSKKRWKVPQVELEELEEI